MRKVYLFLAGFFILFFPLYSYAYIGLCCGKCGGNMPMNILGAGVPETNEFRFKFSPMFMRMGGLQDGTDSVNDNSILGMPSMGKFMAVPTGMDMYMTNIASGYSFTDDFMGGIMFMWKKNSMDMTFNSMMKSMTGKDGFAMKSEGMADTMLMSKYRLYTDDPLIPKSQVSFFSGLNLPTGSINERNSNHPVASRTDEYLPYSMQLGSGTFDPMFGFVYQGSATPWWWGANLIYTGRWYKNALDYSLGDEIKIDLYAMYQVRYDFVAQIQLNGRFRGKIKGEMDEAKTGESGRASQGDPSTFYMSPLWDTDNYGSQQISVTAGFQWQPFPLHIVELDLGVPVYQRVNGIQPKEDYRIMFTWYIELPTPSSIRYTGTDKQGKSRLGF